MQKINANDPLAMWVSKVGGINPHYAHDMRQGEIRRITEARRGLPPGAINKNAPLTLEEIAQRAYDTGYTSDNEIDSFLEALEQDVAASCNNQPHRRVYTWESPRRYKLQEAAYMAAGQTIETTATTLPDSPQFAVIKKNQAGAPGTRTALDTEALLRAEIARLTTEIAQRKEAQKRKVYCEVAVKSKWMSLKGLGRFPITLPKEWWYMILDDLADEIRTFLQEHDSELKNKD